MPIKTSMSLNEISPPHCATVHINNSLNYDKSDKFDKFSHLQRLGAAGWCIDEGRALDRGDAIGHRGSHKLLKAALAEVVLQDDSAEFIILALGMYEN